MTRTNSAGNPYYVGGLIGFNAGSVAQSYATGAVTGLKEVGWLVGSIGSQYGQGGATISSGYWDTSTAGSYTGSPVPGIGFDISGNT